MFKRAVRWYWNFNVRVFTAIANYAEEHMWMIPLGVGLFVAFMVSLSIPDNGSCQ